MSSAAIQATVILLSYAILFVGIIFGIHFGIVDSQVGSLVIGGILTHFSQNVPVSIPMPAKNGVGTIVKP